MQKIPRENVNKYRIRGDFGYNTELKIAMSELAIGEAVLLRQQEWCGKSLPHAIVGGVNQNNKRNDIVNHYRIRKLEANEPETIGWLIIRDK